MVSKSRLLEHIDKFPEEFSLEHLIEKIEVGIIQSTKGKVFSEEEIDMEIEQWFN
jgi:hypothetical protein